MNIINLERALRKGRTPEDIGCVVLGEGAQKKGYCYTTTRGRKYVIKENSGGWMNHNQKLPPDLTAYGCATIYQTKAGKWIIQELVTPLRTRGKDDYLVPKNHPAWKIFYAVNARERGDYHAANFGIREDGTLVCFDW